MELTVIKKRVIEGDAKGTVAGIREVLAEEAPARDILEKALIPAMEEVGDLFAAGEYFVPELLLAARCMTSALEILRPQLGTSGYEPIGQVIVGTVQGDLHDIGKKLVGILLEGNGFEVLDLGSDVAPERFVEAVQESGARLVGLSALLTTTLPAMQATIRALRQAEFADEVHIMIGGAPVTDVFAREIGADGYGADASAAVALARQLLHLPERPAEPGAG